MKNIKFFLLMAMVMTMRHTCLGFGRKITRKPQRAVSFVLHTHSVNCKLTQNCSIYLVNVLADTEKHKVIKYIAT